MSTPSSSSRPSSAVNERWKLNKEGFMALIRSRVSNVAEKGVAQGAYRSEEIGKGHVKRMLNQIVQQDNGEVTWEFGVFACDELFAWYLPRSGIQRLVLNLQPVMDQTGTFPPSSMRTHYIPPELLGEFIRSLKETSSLTELTIKIHPNDVRESAMNEPSHVKLREHYYRLMLDFCSVALLVTPCLETFTVDCMRVQGFLNHVPKTDGEPCELIMDLLPPPSGHAFWTQGDVTMFAAAVEHKRNHTTAGGHGCRIQFKLDPNDRIAPVIMNSIQATSL